MKFELKSSFVPTGDQPQAISQLVAGVRNGDAAQTLLGVTGSGKTFTVANVIAQINKPTLVLSHNKTLAAQLYGEFKSFFPDNAVEYFVSYYDYYQPEAYIPVSDTYIEKDMAINAEIEKLRLKATAALLSGRQDVIVVSSVSCLYGMADPKAFEEKVIHLRIGQKLSRNILMRQLVESYYTNDKIEFNSGDFRVRGDTIDVFPAIEGYEGMAYRIEFWDNEIEHIASFNPISGEEYGPMSSLQIHPANLFVTTKEQVDRAVSLIDVDLGTQKAFLEKEGKALEAQRLYERVTYDLEMIRELGYCSGIENYSRYFDGRKAGERPFCLLDYFPKDFLMVIDESHVTIPQVRAMYGGDRSRKENLVHYGFRLPAALDNRPLTFEEFCTLTHQTIYISATPADYELGESEGIVVEQVIRPTGLLDPIIEVRPTEHQIDDLEEEISCCIERKERVLVTTLTKRMAEELSDYLSEHNYNTAYIHSDVDTLERIRIMEDLRRGVYDVLVGVNLLREGLDLPEVSLVAILDADKEGFLRSHRSLTQTAGRAARHINGRVIFYADKITESMQRTIDETERRREKQMAYNRANRITPKQVVKNLKSILDNRDLDDKDMGGLHAYVEPAAGRVTDPIVDKLTSDKLKDLIELTRKKMLDAAAELDFLEAARLRDELHKLEARLKASK
ncbi:excinuclease ABC subunit B [Porphyromonas crevioricanis JCM 15906]|uniref:UvrABC system protein B n=1 Tax=Porphyromonas crevioricanis JCM 15906 TaxID=1305617 RepID=T1CNG7_9PORP|nr:excinuclease ABC subunit UvrB [Porphyromonas crevioricanis]GAD05362.1 excinuclease ABC subunit B [Porphyromonas crevioricanis JCM 15906]SJZ56901.1 Excinuclease ABC subunit B [Porphyromonas crevioricanis]